MKKPANSHIPLDTASSKLRSVLVNVTSFHRKVGNCTRLEKPEIKGVAGDCWVWIGPLYNGYARLHCKGITGDKAHRTVYQSVYGPLDPNLELDHLCQNRACVNPAHLEPVTRAENLRRSHTTGKGNGTLTHCRRGHELTDRNVYAWRGKRFCRQCQSLRQKAMLRRKRELLGIEGGVRASRFQSPSALLPEGNGGSL